MPLSIEQAEEITRDFLAEYNGNIPLRVRIGARQEDIYGPDNSEDRRGVRIEGGYHPSIGRITLIASRFHNEKQVARTLRHEILGHYGLNTFKPDQKLDLLNRVLETREERSLAHIWQKVDQLYPELSDLKKAEEVFAFVAEDQRSFMQRGWDRVRASLQKALRASGLSDRPLTLPELRQEAQAIANGIRGGRRQQQTFPANDHAQFRKEVTMARQNSKPTFAEQVADQIIEQLKQGTAPWAKPWQPNEYQLPHNPVTGTVYKGINHLHLACKPHSDPRWMTYKQAQAAGYQVMKGSKSTTVQYWKFQEKRAKRDADGKEVKDEQGNTVMVTYKLERPKTFYAKVFNAEQIDGIPPMPPRQPLLWNPHERAETILSNSGADIRHDQADRAYYRPSTDSIHLPSRDQFPSADNYYATALHELGHWTGHPSRLDRDLSHPFGTPGYAKEELRAEISSFMFNTELGLGHDPGQHVAYVGSWIKALQEDPQEIFRAASDAEKIKTYVLDLARTQTLEQEQQQDQVQPLQPTITDEIKAELQRYHDDAVEGYSPKESWENLQAIAEERGLVAHIEKAPESDELSEWHISYTDEGRPTTLKTELGRDGKALSLHKGHRIEGTGYTSAHDWQREQLNTCIDRYQARDKKLSQADTLKILDKDHEAALAQGTFSARDTWQTLQAAAQERSMEAEITLNHGIYTVTYSEGGQPTGVTTELTGDGKAVSYYEGVRDNEYSARTTEKEEQLSNFHGCVDRYQFVKQIRLDHQGAQMSAPSMAPSEEAKMSPRNIATEDTPLAIPYRERNEAKRLAGKLASGENALGWDKDNKTWYAKPGADLDALKAYLPENIEHRQEPVRSSQQELAETLEANGFQLKEAPLMDGKWHRVPVTGDKDGQTSGAYRVYADGRPAGHYQNHREHDEPVKWVASGQRLSDTERAKLQAESATKNAQRQAERDRKYDHHAKRCEQLWSQLGPATGNRYLQNKGVKNYDVRMDKKGRLVVPLRNSQGQIRSIQRISSNGFKSLKKGAEKMGNFHVLNADKLAGSKDYFIAEGYATAASIAEATNMPVVAAIDAGNIPTVAQEFNRRYPEKGMVIAGDDDRFNEKNKGRKKAEEAADLIGAGARSVFPRFGSTNPDKLSDFNDLHQRFGIEALQSQLRPAVRSLHETRKSTMEQKSKVQKIDSEKQSVSRSR